jgi:ribosomal protein S18 acetylase RimI-like enzyme
VARLWVAAALVDNLEAATAEATRAFLADPSLFLVAIDDGAVAATIYGSIDVDRGMLRRLAVLPDHRKRGIGTALVRTLEQRLADRGAGRFRLHVFETNAGGAAFWRAMGYDRIPAHYMGKPGGPLPGARVVDARPDRPHPR